jgi:hypothetical protein
VVVFVRSKSRNVTSSQGRADTVEKPLGIKMDRNNNDTAASAMSMMID